MELQPLGVKNLLGNAAGEHLTLTHSRSEAASVEKSLAYQCMILGTSTFLQGEKHPWVNGPPRGFKFEILAAFRAKDVVHLFAPLGQLVPFHTTQASGRLRFLLSNVTSAVAIAMTVYFDTTRRKMCIFLVD